MITRSLARSRNGRSIQRRNAWIAFDDSAVDRIKKSPSGEINLDRAHSRGVPAADYESRWIMSYQRGEIIALVQRVKELEGRLERRSITLAGALALIGLGGVGFAAWWISGPLLGPSGMGVPLIAEVPGAHMPAPLPPAAGPLPVRAANRAAMSVASTAAAQQAATPERSPAMAVAVLQSDRIVAGTTGAPVAPLGPPSADPVVVGPLPVNAPTHVTVNFPRDDPDAEQLAGALAQHLRGRGLSVGNPSSIPRRPTEPSIAYFFDEDHDGAVAVERILGGLLGKSRLVPRPQADPLPRPGSIVVVMPAH
jgi:hypothetical protein